MAEASQTTEEKKRREENSYYNKLLNKRSYIIKTFSFPNTPFVEQLLKQVEKIAKLDGWTKSQVHLKALNLLVDKYGEGNPQLKIASYLPTTEKSPMRVLCAFLNGATTEGRVHCTKYGGSWVLGVKCYGCNLNQFRKKKEASS